MAVEILVEEQSMQAALLNLVPGILGSDVEGLRAVAAR